MLGLALLGYALLIFGVQRRLVFPGMFRDSPRATASAPEGVTQVWLETSFGQVEAWFFNAEGGIPGPTILFAHGNGELIEDWESEMGRVARGRCESAVGGVSRIRSLGRQAVPLDNTRDIHTRLRLACRAGRRRRRSNRSVRKVYRRVALPAIFSLDRPVRALVLQSTFSSAAAIARESMVPGFLVRDRFDNQRAVADFSGPILLMHGIDDDVIPYSHAETLARTREELEINENRLCAQRLRPASGARVVEYLTEFLRNNALLE